MTVYRYIFKLTPIWRKHDKIGSYTCDHTATEWVRLITGTAILALFEWGIPESAGGYTADINSYKQHLAQKIKEEHLASSFEAINSKNNFSSLTFLLLVHRRVPSILSLWRTCCELNCHAPVKSSRATLTP